MPIVDLKPYTPGPDSATGVRVPAWAGPMPQPSTSSGREDPIPDDGPPGATPPR